MGKAGVLVAVVLGVPVALLVGVVVGVSVGVPVGVAVGVSRTGDGTRRPFSPAIAISTGICPTETLRRTRRVAVSIIERKPSSAPSGVTTKFVTTAKSPFGVIAIAAGTVPTS